MCYEINSLGEEKPFQIFGARPIYWLALAVVIFVAAVDLFG